MADRNTSVAIVTTNDLNNSNKARREEGERKELPAIKTEKKAHTTAKVRKESIGSKFKRAFFGENVENVGEYMIFDVAIPAFKATISDMIGNGIEVLLFGESRGRRSRGSDNYRNYASLSRSDRDRSRDDYNRRDRRRNITYNDITFETKSAAKEFLSEVLDYVKEYDRISVSVYSTILEQYCDEKLYYTWQDDRIGWYLDDFENPERLVVRSGRDDWMIDIRKPGRI